MKWFVAVMVVLLLLSACGGSEDVTGDGIADSYTNKEYFLSADSPTGEVTSESSGAFRGSTRYIIDSSEVINNPVQIDGLRAGDFISWKLPSTDTLRRYESDSIYLRRYDTSRNMIIIDYGFEKQIEMPAGTSHSFDINKDDTNDVTITFSHFSGRTATVIVGKFVEELLNNETVVEDELVIEEEIIVEPIRAADSPAVISEPVDEPIPDTQPEKKSPLALIIILGVLALLAIAFFILLKMER